MLKWNIYTVLILCFICVSCSQQQKQKASDDGNQKNTADNVKEVQANGENGPTTGKELAKEENIVAPSQELNAEQKQKILASWEKKIGVYQYEIKIDDGSSCEGHQVVRISRVDAETWVVESEITIEATMLGITVYSYNEKSREVWKGTVLESFTDSVDDNGDECEVNMKVEGGNISGTINKKQASFAIPSALALCCWNTSELYPLFSPYSMMYVDDQTVKTDTYQVEDLGEEKINLGNKSVVCKHVKLARPESNKWHMWFLPSGVPAKHVDDVDGHKTEFSLKSWVERE